MGVFRGYDARSAQKNAPAELREGVVWFGGPEPK